MFEYKKLVGLLQDNFDCKFYLIHDNHSAHVNPFIVLLSFFKAKLKNIHLRREKNHCVASENVLSDKLIRAIFDKRLFSDM